MKIPKIFLAKIIDRLSWIALVATGIYLGVQIAIIILQALL